jgi:hypothetical protein
MKMSGIWMFLVFGCLVFRSPLYTLTFFKLAQLDVPDLNDAAFSTDPPIPCTWCWPIWSCGSFSDRRGTRTWRLSPCTPTLSSQRYETCAEGLVGGPQVVPSVGSYRHQATTLLSCQDQSVGKVFI